MQTLVKPSKPACSKPKTDEEFILQEKTNVAANPLYLVFAGLLSIKTKRGELIHLKQNSTQRKLFNKIQTLRQEKKPVRIWVLKYRQGGISTDIEGIIYSLTSQQPNRNSLIMADEKEHANNLFEMFKLYQEKLEEEAAYLAPQLKKSNEKKLEYENIHSQIIIASAENKESAKSHTFHYVHLSEVAFFPDLKTVLGDLNQTVPDHADTMIIGETTANGMNEFYDQWLRAIEGKTDWIPLFFAWFEMEEYSLPLQDGKLYPLEGINFDADTSIVAFEKSENELRAKFHITEEQINWRRWAIINKCQGDINTFKREYPATWEEAFAMSGDMFFDKEGLAKQAPKRPIATGEIFFENMKWTWRDLPHGRVSLYERPEKGEQYVIAGDASEAVGSDEAAALVLNKRTNSTAAIVAGQHSPEELAQLLIGLGHYFNEGKIAQENKGYGYQVNQLVFQNYGNIYRRMVDKDGIQVEKDELGFNTNTVTRPQALAMMAEEIKHNSTILNSKELISECRTFIIKKDKDGKVTKVEAQTGYQDGLVICRAIAGYVRNQEPYRADMSISSIESRQRAAVEKAAKPYGFKH